MKLECTLQAQILSIHTYIPHYVHNKSSQKLLSFDREKMALQGGLLLLENDVKLESTLHGYSVTVRLGLCISIDRPLLVYITRTNTVCNGKESRGKFFTVGSSLECLMKQNSAADT